MNKAAPIQYGAAGATWSQVAPANNGPKMLIRLPSAVLIPLTLPARPKLLSEGGNRSRKVDFKFFFGGKFLNSDFCSSSETKSDPMCMRPLLAHAP